MGLKGTTEAPPDRTVGERELSTYLTRVILAKCANCRKRETVSPDIMKRAVELLLQRGWRAYRMGLVCKECANGQ